jgi:hypothetical protein
VLIRSSNPLLVKIGLKHEISCFCPEALGTKDMKYSRDLSLLTRALSSWFIKGKSSLIPGALLNIYSIS